MATDRGRFRADLVDLAWGEETVYGEVPGLAQMRLLR